jgi:hypothetical protein
MSTHQPHPADLLIRNDPLDRLVEECAALIHAVAKAKRFGLRNHHPARPNITNEEELRLDMHDVRKAILRAELHLRAGDQATSPDVASRLAHYAALARDAQFDATGDLAK